jgi:hypothetical protein
MKRKSSVTYSAPPSRWRRFARRTWRRAAHGIGNWYRSPGWPLRPRWGDVAKPELVPPEEWEALRAEARRHAGLPGVPSPGGWTAPPGVLPSWNWMPEPGAVPRLDRVPRWVRAWYHTPLVDRFAHSWMWYRGGWDVVPPDSWSPETRLS